MSSAPPDSSVGLPSPDSLQLARGDANAIAELLEFFRPWLENLAAARFGKRIRGKVTRSEIAQVVIISANETFDQFRGTNVKSLYNWLAQILENRIADQVRQFIAAKARCIDRESPLSHDPPGNSHRPSQIVSNQEQIARVLAGIEALPEPLRIVVRLRYVSDKSFNMIADELNVPESTVRRRWHEALQILKNVLA